jgi:hypothetical protein
MKTNLQHSKETTKTSNIQKQEQKPSTFLKAKTINLSKNKDKNLQPLRSKTKAFNLFKFLRARTRTFNLQEKNKCFQPF